MKVPLGTGAHKVQKTLVRVSLHMKLESEPPMQPDVLPLHVDLPVSEHPYPMPDDSNARGRYCLINLS